MSEKVCGYPDALAVAVDRLVNNPLSNIACSSCVTSGCKVRAYAHRINSDIDEKNDGITDSSSDTCVVPDNSQQGPLLAEIIQKGVDLMLLYQT